MKNKNYWKSLLENLKLFIILFGLIYVCCCQISGRIKHPERTETQNDLQFVNYLLLRFDEKD